MDVQPSFSTSELLGQAAWLRGLARTLVADEDTADDLTQETLVAALQARPRTDRPLRPWLASVLRRRRIGRLRGQATRVDREAARAVEEALPSTDELAARAEVQRRLVAEVLALADPYRSVLLLRYYEGLDVGDIARRRGSTPGSVRGQLSRATALLRERLDRGDGERAWRLALVPLAGFELPKTAGPKALTLLMTMKTSTKAVLAACLLGNLVALYLGTTLTADRDRTQEAADPVAAASDPVPGRGTTPVVRLDGGDGGAEREVAAPPSDAAADASTAAASRAPVQGTLSTTGGEPLASFLLELRSKDGAAERFTTDAEGRFEGAVERPAGEYVLVALDHPDLSFSELLGGEPRRDRAAPRHAVTWTPGTPLDVRIAPRLEFPVRLVGPDKAAASVGELSLFGGSPDAGEGDLRPLFIPLRLDAPLRGEASDRWVRFAPVHVGGGADRVLRGESGDGLWVAEAPVPEAERRHGDAVVLHLEPRGRLEIALPWGGDEAPAEMHASLQPLAAADSARTLGGPLTAVDGEPGSTLMVRGGLLPGSYRVSAFATGTEVVRAEVEVLPGEVTRTTIELDHPAELHPLRVFVHSESGTFDGTVSMQAARDGGRRFGGGTVEWSDVDGARVGVQDLGPVPPGEYTISVMMSLEAVEWELPVGTVTVPGPPVDVFALDGAPACDLVLLPRDAATGDPLETGTVRLRKAGDTSYFGLAVLSQRRGEARWEDIPTDAPLTWHLEVPGYEALEGRWDEVPMRGGVRRLEIRAERLP